MHCSELPLRVVYSCCSYFCTADTISVYYGCLSRRLCTDVYEASASPTRMRHYLHSKLFVDSAQVKDVLRIELVVRAAVQILTFDKIRRLLMEITSTPISARVRLWVQQLPQSWRVVTTSLKFRMDNKSSAKGTRHDSISDARLPASPSVCP